MERECAAGKIMAATGEQSSALERNNNYVDRSCLGRSKQDAGGERTEARNGGTESGGFGSVEILRSLV